MDGRKDGLDWTDEGTDGWISRKEETIVLSVYSTVYKYDGVPSIHGWRMK